ncbi:ComEC/Rec2 family competence protein [Arcobacteraceae bacterium]|nr:ComEC/Rec2 family competence protein [Arcobacteraceae bacterium]
MESLSLFNTNKEKKIFFLLILFTFIFNVSMDYIKYKNFIKNEIFKTNGIVLNIYHKAKYIILKVETDNFTFFTSIVPDSKIKLFYEIDLFILTQDINFISYLQGFYTKSFNIIEKPRSILKKEKIYNLIDSQHTNKEISSLYSALFIATSLTTKIRQISSQLGISHLIAISGFHLGVISFVLYFIIHLLYSSIHTKLIPYRNKKFDILLCIVGILFLYLIFLNNPPSLLRAFVMFTFALFLLRNNIKVISFETLLIITLFIVVIFPKLLFSLSLLFSISGVFYIFLFLKYFKNLNKYIQFIIFNFWIYFAINPITHYFFGTLSKEQLYSPILTILFTLFYPLSILLHSFNIGDLFDNFLQSIINLNITSIEIFTPFWIFLFYIGISLFASKYKSVFILLNTLIISYNIWLFSFIF